MGSTASIAASFGARLKELRVKAGLTQAELAEQAGLHRFGVAKLEQGQREPTWATVLALAAALGVEVTAFVVQAGANADAKKAPKKAKA